MQILPLIWSYVLTFSAGRQSADIVNWLKKKTGPSATKLEDVASANQMIEKDEVVVIGYFKVGKTKFIGEYFVGRMGHTPAETSSLSGRQLNPFPAE